MNSNLKSEINELQHDHEEIRREFKELVILGREVDEKCSDNPNVPKNIYNFLMTFWVTIEALIQKEESYIFPLVLEDRSCEAYSEIQDIISTHRKLEVELKQIMRRVLNYELDSNSCELWKELVSMATLLAEKTNNHIEKEDQTLRKCILFFNSDSYDELELELELELYS